jgi:hypothetical protein
VSADQRKAKTRVKLKKPPVLYRQTQKILTQVQKAVNKPVLTYWNSSRGSVCHNDVVGFYEILDRIGDQPQLALFIKSGGGTATAALRIVNLLRHRASDLTALIPLECQSAATMIALGADRIHMGPMAHLGAVDTSLVHELSPTDQSNELVSVSHDEVSRLVKLWREAGDPEGGANPYPALFEHIHPLVIGAVDRASSLSVKLCSEILSYHMKDKKKASRISRHLTSSYPSHSYPITLREARRIGLKTSDLDPAINDLLIELNELYSEMGQRAITDYDEENYHDNEIVNILEARDIQVFYQTEKDWHYRKEERRWITLNDQSGWQKIERRGKRVSRSRFHIR